MSITNPRGQLCPTFGVHLSGDVELTGALGLARLPWYAQHHRDMTPMSNFWASYPGLTSKPKEVRFLL